MNNFFAHLHTVRTHRKWVRHYCFQAGLYWQGITHDLSKYHPIEFFESVKYYQGNRSPIDARKEQMGYSNAWFHHRKNKHHMERWTDNYDSGTSCVPMPYKYVTELICDWLGAGKAYMGAAFSYERELDFVKKKLEKGIKMHPRTAAYVYTVFEALTRHPEVFVFTLLKEYYNAAWDSFDENKYPFVYFGSSKDYFDELIA